MKGRPDDSSQGRTSELHVAEAGRYHVDVDMSYRRDNATFVVKVGEQHRELALSKRVVASWSYVVLPAGPATLGAYVDKRDARRGVRRVRITRVE